jgi:hypothetical protein
MGEEEEQEWQQGEKEEAGLKGTRRRQRYGLTVFEILSSRGKTTREESLMYFWYCSPNLKRFK